MSAIPPNWLGSILGTPAAQGRAGADRAKSQADEAQQTGGDAFADRLQNVIDEGDRDGQVYSDAEGTGSQGRESDSPETAADPATDPLNDDPAGQQPPNPHPPALDLQA
jgi:hypothetical protein